MIITNKDTVYSVVDMETTGTDINNGDQIIQFSVVFVQNGKVIDSYSTYVNNGEEIPQEITKLTGISEKTIKNAPTFDQLAPIIYKKLKNTVFVAHNVNFDFPFLNNSLEQVGYPTLDNDAIDTVTLSQIFFPTLTSYRLSHLSSYFHILHDHPHSSFSDAKATADLLLIIYNKINSLPIDTIKSILEINLDLPQQTNDFIKSIYQEKLSKNNNALLSDDLVNVEGLILRKHQIKLNNNQEIDKKFPKTKHQKQLLLENKFKWRESQSKMMNLIYRNYTDSQKTTDNLLIEAPTGSGKTLGYLLPMAFIAAKGKPVVISTATIALQEQLSQILKYEINDYFGFNLNTSILKGKNHYIDLSRFVNNLVVNDDNKLSQFIKAQILVWLTETTTGDLDELHLPTEAAILKQISYQSGKNNFDNEFGEYDFLEWQKKKLQVSDMIVVNHNYLFKNAKKIHENLNTNPYLIIDEAHRLADVAFDSQKQSLWLGTIKLYTGRIKNDVFQTHNKNLMDIFDDDISLNNELKKIMKKIDEVFEVNSKLLNQFQQNFMHHLSNEQHEIGLKTTKLNKYFENVHNDLKKQFKLNEQIKKLLNQINIKISKSVQKWTASDYKIFLQFNDHVNHINNFITKVQNIVNQINVSSDSEVFWLNYSDDMDVNNVYLSLARFDTSSNLNKKIYRYFEPVVFTGSVLFTSKKSQYIYDQLDLHRSNTRMKRLKNSFDYAKQSQIVISKETPTPENYENDEYVNYLANSIQKLFEESPQPTLVLFNSMNLIKAVYERLNGNDNSYAVLASGISGGQEKIIKRFEANPNSIILGSNAFWEGIDFPKHYLKSIIIPRIPFPAPNNPIVKARASYLKKKKKNPFTSYSLPQAIMDIKQGIGRLIRNKQDYGTITILDNRIITKKYGKQIMKAIDNGVAPEVGSIEKIAKKNIEFLKQHHQK
ncbi:helicase C-terminal domain-containing protein [Fructilactobacillus lindneri]|uniref:helicase C-terminal domain-containing protein n=1 Tax=Fructilactobacillus lindneri TaxID=53444 RepID=UPI0006CF912F|nr:helicase C-terminal domain-containing protein [Fructilactobacillus lindneri]POH07669.1 hypothetical protein BGL35_00920 [Fructilactobacillus lindneri]SJZ77555.1 ATP-dependent DNA helicase DinG [Fructilactobacillus lindneri DSM 20690 = JCM 11027]